MVADISTPQPHTHSYQQSAKKRRAPNRRAYRDTRSPSSPDLSDGLPSKRHRGSTLHSSKESANIEAAPSKKPPNTLPLFDSSKPFIDTGQERIKQNLQLPTVPFTPPGKHTTEAHCRTPSNLKPSRFDGPTTPIHFNSDQHGFRTPSPPSAKASRDEGLKSFKDAPDSPSSTTSNQTKRCLPSFPPLHQRSNSCNTASYVGTPPSRKLFNLIANENEDPLDQDSPSVQLRAEVFKSHQVTSPPRLLKNFVNLMDCAPPIGSPSERSQLGSAMTPAPPSRRSIEGIRLPITPQAPMRPRYSKRSIAIGILRGSRRTVQDALKAGEDPNSQISLKGERILPILGAAIEGRASIVKALLQSGAVPNSVNSKGQTALHLIGLTRINNKDPLRKETVIDAGPAKVCIPKAWLDLKTFLDEMAPQTPEAAKYEATYAPSSARFSQERQSKEREAHQRQLSNEKQEIPKFTLSLPTVHDFSREAPPASEQELVLTAEILIEAGIDYKRCDLLGNTAAKYARDAGLLSLYTSLQNAEKNPIGERSVDVPHASKKELGTTSESWNQDKKGSSRKTKKDDRTRGTLGMVPHRATEGLS